MMDMNSLSNFMDDTVLPSMGICSDIEGYSHIKSQLTNLFSNIILYIKTYAEVNIDGCLIHSCLGESKDIGNLVGSIYAPVPSKIK